MSLNKYDKGCSVIICTQTHPNRAQEGCTFIHYENDCHVGEMQCLFLKLILNYLCFAVAAESDRIEWK